MGALSARSTRIPSITRNTGFNTFPIQVMISPGLREKNRTTAKNKNENAACQSIYPLPDTAFAGRILSIPTVKETEAHRGVAKNGPIVRYRAQVKKMPNFFPTLLASPCRPFSRLMPRAATLRSGSPTPVTRNPAAACHIFLPAICPIDTGKIRFPAPKNIPKSILATKIVSLNVNFFISQISPFSFYYSDLVTETQSETWYS